MDLDGKLTLVTGANGFIGSHLVKRLAQTEGANVRALVRRMPSGVDSEATHPHIQYFLGDVTDSDAVQRAAAGCDVLVHTAACQPGHPMPSRSRFFAVNVEGTRNLIRAFAPLGVGRFLLLSTINVHGLPPPPGAHADSPLKHSGDRYSDSKVDGERAAWDLARELDIPLTVIRPACTFGPGGGAWTLGPLDRIRRGTPVLIGNGQGICNPIYIENLVDLIVSALRDDSAVNQGFIGSQGTRIQWSEFFAEYGRMIGKTPRALPLPFAKIVGSLSYLLEGTTGNPGPLTRSSIEFYTHNVTFNVEKNARLLNFYPRISFEEGMSRTESWLRVRKLL